MLNPANIPLSLYVHIPWCVRKCPYCDFNSHTSAKELPEHAYVDALLADLQQSLPLAANRSLCSIFIGGGTPSLFSADAIARLLEGIEQYLPFEQGIEISMEANPGTLEYGKFSTYRAVGVNRVSVGIQSFDDDALQQLGRIHNGNNARHAIEAIIDAGYDRWNLDLMHGLPGQSVAAARQDLEIALQYSPPHLSWYQLTIEPNTAFYSAPPLLPVEDTLADIQDAGESLLLDNDFDHYEVSAWGKYRCSHNLNYWQFGDYLGIGAGAHGKLSNKDGTIQRFWKKKQPDAYLKALNSGAFIGGQRSLNDDEKVFEFFLNSLRLNIPQAKTLLNERTGLAWAFVESRIESLQDQGLLQTNAEQFATSSLGQRFLNDVLQQFMPESGD